MTTECDVFTGCVQRILKEANITLSALEVNFRHSWFSLLSLHSLFLCPGQTSLVDQGCSKWAGNLTPGIAMDEWSHLTTCIISGVGIPSAVAFTHFCPVAGHTTLSFSLATKDSSYHPHNRNIDSIICRFGIPAPPPNHWYGSFSNQRKQNLMNLGRKKSLSLNFSAVKFLFFFFFQRCKQ